MAFYVYMLMNKILFVWHGSTAGSRDLAALVGQNGAKCGNRSGGVLRVRGEAIRNSLQRR